ncbi:MAG: hypothetical protein H0X37_12675 [Herpetosiphonaceae bacterium]|nr:hypothetical protein [Herpetosiphonaceae bacterium]
MTGDEEVLHQAQQLPPRDQTKSAGEGPRYSAEPKSAGEDPETRQRTGREPLKNVEATLEKIDDNPEIEGT